MNDTVIDKAPGFRTRPFSGSPKHYLSIAFAIGAGTHVWLYGGLFIIEYWWHGRDWIIGWKPITFSLLSAAVLTRHTYQSIMGLDAHRGRGSRWQLTSRHIKLPERKV
ncbi:MAG: hypothetical protein D6160_21270 [Ketobacter sp.]|nr:MAG: hypothetical protein D6160_21270 [Ketobacter sp.]